MFTAYRWETLFQHSGVIDFSFYVVVNLQFVMPDCKIRLSVLNPQQKREKEEADPTYNIFVKEDPPETFLQMVKDSDYYVFVEQAEDQLKRDQERMRLIASQMEGANLVGSCRNEKDNVGTESCSCIFGNPCVVK